MSYQSQLAELKSIIEKIEYYSHIQENAIDNNMIIEYYSIEFLAGAQLELFLQASMRA